MLRLVILLTCLLLPAVVKGQPAELFGIELGASLDLARCLSSERDSKTIYVPDGEICWYAKIGEVFDLETTEFALIAVVMSSTSKPDFLKSDVSLIVSEGRVVQIVIPTFGERSWSEVQGRLIKKFGPPSNRATLPPGSVWVETSDWGLGGGDKLAHRAFGGPGKENQGVVTATAKEWSDSAHELGRERESKQKQL